MNKKDKIKKYEEVENAVLETKDSQDAEQSKNETNQDEPDSLDALQEKLNAAQQQSKENYDRLLRVSAEFENYKKRTARDMSEFKKYANETLLKELLTVVDNLERALLSTVQGEAPADCFIEGVQMTLKELLKVLSQFGVEALDALGKEFDPIYHQAMMQEETDAVPENTVIKEMQRGYLLHDRLLRPSMVVVSKAKTVPENAPRATEDDTENEK